MLFALDWMQRVRHAIHAVILTFVESLSFLSITHMMTDQIFFLILWAAAGLALCFVGFRANKLVHEI